jgi:hypothetical protein
MVAENGHDEIHGNTELKSQIYKINFNPFLSKMYVKYRDYVFALSDAVLGTGNSGVCSSG